MIWSSSFHCSLPYLIMLNARLGSNKQNGSWTLNSFGHPVCHCFDSAGVQTPQPTIWKAGVQLIRLPVRIHNQITVVFPLVELTRHSRSVRSESSENLVLAFTWWTGVAGSESESDRGVHT